MLGWRTVCAVERDAHCASILAQRQNDGCLRPFPIWSDVCSFDGRPWRGAVDVVSGGFPCQDISPAGKGAGIRGERSGLWAEFARIVGDVRPGYVWVENSSALSTRGIDVVLADLASLGFDAEWCVLGADAVGFPHQRARMWILAAHPERRQRWQEPHDGTRGRMGGQQQPFAWDRHWLDVFTRVRGTGDGMANRLDRTDAIRNGQVPRVAARAFRELHARLER
ncbi:DNA cytosine methyltransferase [Stenotrophomonas indicatrix]|uniref:DNA cytosine methyltransferase n=1 Tax=Stenotrophomonas indicatrix TaxID=2045451 RepID=UPI0031BB77D6